MEDNSSEFSKTLNISTTKIVKFRRVPEHSNVSSQISDKIRWFPFLIDNPRRSGGSALFSTLQHLPGITFLVRRTFRNYSMNTYKRFGLFSNFVDFFGYNATIPEQDREFHEVITDDSPITPYFDLDISEEVLDGIDSKNRENIEYEVSRLADCAQTIAAQLGAHDACALVFSSNSSKKLSFHIVITGAKVSEISDGPIMVTQPSDAARLFCQLTLDRYYTMSASGPNVKIVMNSVDVAIYKKLSSLRMVGSQKLGTGRIKIFRQDLSPKGSTLPRNHFVGVPEDVRFFAASLIGITTDSQSIVMQHTLHNAIGTVVRRKNLQTRFSMSACSSTSSDEISLSHEHAFEAFTEICSVIQEEGGDTNFEIRDQFSSFSIGDDGFACVPLRQTHEYHCVVCDRSHSAENPYMLVNVITGLVLFNCRRSEQSIRTKVDSLKLVAINKQQSSSTDKYTFSELKKCIMDEDCDGINFPIGASAVSDDDEHDSKVSCSVKTSLTSETTSLCLTRSRLSRCRTLSTPPSKDVLLLPASKVLKQVESVIASSVSNSQKLVASHRKKKEALKLIKLETLFG